MAFTAGTVFTADMLNEAWPATVEDDEAANEDNITSTVYIAGTVSCVVTFTAPTSGRVKVSIAGALRATGDPDTVAGDHVLLSFEVRRDGEAGTVVFSADDENAVSTQIAANALERQATFKLVPGLVPGATYLARTMHRVTGGTTGDVLHRRIMVEPLS